ncbi:energy-coupling factor transporter transmembrane component T [Pectinatus brassicae]|uniref:Cobalt/nickel transport system permease protein n=1 Tax=Pectinatus brassicae TaxID=862415 RepID=A0A840UDN4_9FIRM|nr:energy-coupling factor transporter transmembrane component T [Pectinatus brassicae]MBB5335216.1 cobalt/nickel transport system permease protein [Pectinatus brassicae]
MKEKEQFNVNNKQPHRDIPMWLLQNDDYLPQKDRERYLSKTLLGILGRLIHFRQQMQIQTESFFSVTFKLIYVFLLIFSIALAHTITFLLLLLAGLLAYICLLDGRQILSLLKPAIGAMVFTFIIIVPAIFLQGTIVMLLPFKVFLSTLLVAALSRSTPFYLITKALGGLHVPSVFIMSLDLTINYIVLLGNTAIDLLQALKLRSVGRNTGKYESMGNVLGMTFLKSQEYAKQTHAAMLCRGFTGEYHVVQQHHWQKKYIIYTMAIMLLLVLFIHIEGY